MLGAGAIGGLVGAFLGRSGAEVSLIARGAHLEAIRRRGLRVTSDSETFTVHLPATDDPAAVGQVDVVFLGLKAYSYGSARPLLAPLLGPDTAVVPSQNGIPWWYFYKHGGPFEGRRIESVDPGGSVTEAIPPQRVIGCVAYPAAQISEPGVIQHVEGLRFSLGEPDRIDTERCRSFSRVMEQAGLKAPITDIRSQIWLKLMGNVAFNPVSALTGATMAEICRRASSRNLVVRLMEESLSVAKALGDPPPPQMTIERRLAGAERVGDHKTSMLQDLEAGKRIELDALMTAVLELAELVGVDTPHLRAVHASVDLLFERSAADRSVQ